MSHVMEVVVLDASVAVKLVVEEDGSAEAARLLDGRALHAPSLLFIEAANALWAMTRRKILTSDEADDALNVLRSLPLTPMPDGFDPVPQALKLARLLDHPIYDCIYLALAIEVAAPVITADRRFLAAAKSHDDVVTLVRLLGDVEELNAAV